MADWFLKNKDKSSIFEGYDVQIIGKSGNNYIIKETSKPIFRTDLPQQYQYMNFKYPTLNEIRKEVYEGRAISSPGFFVVGYGVTPERVARWEAASTHPDENDFKKAEEFFSNLLNN